MQSPPPPQHLDVHPFLRRAGGLTKGTESVKVMFNACKDM